MKACAYPNVKLNRSMSVSYTEPNVLTVCRQECERNDPPHHLGVWSSHQLRQASLGVSLPLATHEHAVVLHFVSA